MLQVLLLIQLIISVTMVFLILIQRSEGGGLGIGGGGGSMMSARGVANVLTRATSVLAAAFISLALVLTVLAVNRDEATSVVDVLEQETVEDGGFSIALPSNTGNTGAGEDDGNGGDSGTNQEGNGGSDGN